MSRARTVEQPLVDSATANRGDSVPNLSRGRILEHAIIMLDSEGLAGLSMRRLAERLDAGAMSLYWYFSTKDDLLVAATDAVFADVEVNNLPADWDAALVQVLTGFRQALSDHPWSAQIITDAPRIGPQGFRLLDTVIDILSRAGLSGSQLDGAVVTLLSYVLGLAVGAKVWNATVAHESVAALGNSATFDAYPRLKEFYAGSALIDPEVRFQTGLRSLIETIRVPQPAR